MGYASRNNPLTKEKLISKNKIRDLELIRMFPTRAYYSGLITLKELEFIKSNPSNIEIILHEISNK